ncbi:pilus assembly protein TadG-related protein [Streptomyces hebeiensis]|uniref:pilus assembly protein TadG-related protein n=1 Tax=Streptomyces hebeiensis TaxID=229486 RepID=UPI0031DACB1B
MGRSRESGQAVPIYITMVAGLLFLALAFFTVGQAGAARNGAQGAADAAALAAAQESRDQFRLDLEANLLDPGWLDDVFNGNPLGTYDGCRAASQFAALNDAQLVDGDCRALGGGRWGFTVHVENQKPMGENILSAAENKRADAHATAVVEPRCSFEPAEEAEEPPADGNDGDDEGDEGDDTPTSPGSLVCDDGVPWTIEPEHLDLLPDMADLFSVRLDED